MITSKTGTSPIAWALNPLVPLYKPSPRKRPTLPLQNKFNQLLHASTTVSNSFNSCLESLSLQITQYLFNYSLSCPISYLSCAFLPFHLKSIQTLRISFNTDTIIILPITTFSILVRFSFTCPNLNYFNKLLSIQFCRLIVLAIFKNLLNQNIFHRLIC